MSGLAKAGKTSAKFANFDDFKVFMKNADVGPKCISKNSQCKSHPL